jgi:hypothetical protein
MCKRERVWITSLEGRFGRRIAIEIVMKRYECERAEALRKVLACEEPTGEQIESVADRLMEGGVVC